MKENATSKLATHGVPYNGERHSLKYLMKENLRMLLKEFNQDNMQLYLVQTFVIQDLEVQELLHTRCKMKMVISFHKKLNKLHQLLGALKLLKLNSSIQMFLENHLL